MSKQLQLFLATQAYIVVFHYGVHYNDECKNFYYFASKLHEANKINVATHFVVYNSSITLVYTNFKMIMQIPPHRSTDSTGRRPDAAMGCLHLHQGQEAADPVRHHQEHRTEHDLCLRGPAPHPGILQPLLHPHASRLHPNGRGQREDAGRAGGQL